MKISLFIPCLVDQAAPETALAMVNVLERLGHTIVYDPRQTCCGQAPFNAGHWGRAVQLAERFVNIFNDAEVVVAPSGSCVAMVKQHYGELKLHPILRRDWEQLRTRVWEFSSFLVDGLGITDVKAHFPHTAVYHPSCHLTRELGIIEQPLKLLARVGGLKLLKQDSAPECCGFGGTFSLKYPQLSERIGESRAERLAKDAPEFVIGADDSCLGHLRQAFQRLSIPTKTIHIARVLAESKEP